MPIAPISNYMASNALDLSKPEKEQFILQHYYQRTKTLKTNQTDLQPSPISMAFNPTESGKGPKLPHYRTISACSHLQSKQKIQKLETNRIHLKDEEAHREIRHWMESKLCTTRLHRLHF
eukprot:g57122.t1